jgi:hypothetical protein
VTLGSPNEHLDVDAVASYVDGRLSPDERRRTEAHLAACAECRSEVADVGQVVSTQRASPRLRAWIPAAAAAALVLAFALPGVLRQPDPVVHRAAPTTDAGAPRPLSPIGSIDSLSRMIWSAVPSADRYRVRLFDPAGTVLWERETPDTLVAVPDSVAVRPGTPYYWKVEAHSGFDRWAPSDLVMFIR